MKHLNIDFPNIENQRYESLSREELDEEILLQTKRNELFRLKMESKFILDRNTGTIEPAYKSIGNNLNKTISKIERKKYSFDVDEILAIIFVSCLIAVIVTIIILT